MVLEEAHFRFLVAVTMSDPAGLPAQLPEVETLSHLIGLHRLEGRCQRNVRHFERLGYSPDLFAAIERLIGITREEYARNVAALESVVAAVGEDFGVVIKGFSTYLLTGHEATLRCGDIDVVVEGPQRVIAHLLDHGFVQTRPPFLHEIGEFTKDGVEIDLQSCFPVYHYPEGLLRPEGGGTRSLRAHELMSVSRLEPSTLRRNARRVEMGGCHVLVPGPEALVLIIASHCFLNFVNIWSISHREKCWIRLSELADILDLISLPSFSPDAFMDLVEQHQAQHVVHWTATVCRRLLGTSPFDRPGFPESLRVRTTATPCNLWWNLWIDLDPPDRLLLSPRWYPRDEVLRVLDRAMGCPIPLPESTRSTPGPDWAALPHVFDELGRESLIRFFCALRGAELLVALDCAHTALRPGLRLRLDGGIAAVEITTGWNSDRVSAVGADLPIRVTRTAHRLTVTIDVSRMSHRSGGDSANGACCFVAVAAQDNGAILASAVRPIRFDADASFETTPDA